MNPDKIRQEESSLNIKELRRLISFYEEGIQSSIKQIVTIVRLYEDQIKLCEEQIKFLEKYL